MIQIRLLAVSYVQTVLKQNKSQVSHCPSCRKITKGSLQNAVRHTAIVPEKLECYL